MSKLNGSLFLSKGQLKRIQTGKLVKISRGGSSITIGLKGIKSNPIVKISTMIEALMVRRKSLQMKEAWKTRKDKENAK